MYFSHTKHLRPRWHGWLGSSAILNVQLLSLSPPLSAIAVCQPMRREQRNKRSICLFLLKAPPRNGTLDFCSQSLGWNLVKWPCLAIQEAGEYRHQLCNHVLGKTQAFCDNRRKGRLRLVVNRQELLH